MTHHTLQKKLLKITRKYLLLFCAWSLFYMPDHVTWNHPRNLILGWIPRNFKIFIFEPKLSFLRENDKNDRYVEFQDFYEWTLYMIFANFVKNFENHIYGELVKIRDFFLAIVFVIFHQKWQFRLKTKFLKFLGIHPKYTSRCA